MMTSLHLDPLVPWIFWFALSCLCFVGLSVGIIRHLRGWSWRLVSLVILLLALLQPSLMQQEREYLRDIIIILEDQSSSQAIRNRPEQSNTTVQALEEMLANRDGVKLRRVLVPDGEDNSGTRMIRTLKDVLAEEPRAQIAGIIAITDGQVHDLNALPELPAPLHVFLSGEKSGYDRRLIVKNAPAFAIVGEPVTIELRIEELGNIPQGLGQGGVTVSIDGQAPQIFILPTGEDIEVKLTLPHSGANIFEFNLDPLEGELTQQNNVVLLSINGIRDRLRVLLVSGEPHAGGRTWRNLLKSDSSVDLVHFTILRPPGKQDSVPVDELSLIAFPTRELFMEKIDDFDLIIFDRYKRRGILPASYLDNISRYVEDGGAVLVAAGPDFASANSLFRSPLGRVLPAEPTSRVLSTGYVPKITELGERHPVTSGLPAQGDWGRWFRQIEIKPRSGHVLMTGSKKQPLLVLDRVKKGRVALLASDHAWLWDRKFEGGGPQLELLRRLAHWMMSEPDLEEETLIAEQVGSKVRIIRRTLGAMPKEVIVTSPSGQESKVVLAPTMDGLGFEAFFESDELGLFAMQEGEVNSIFALGPSASREFENPVASGNILAPLAALSKGGVFWISDGLPRLRTVLLGRRAAGRGWFAISPREAFDTVSVKKTPLLPGWLVAVLVSLFIFLGWLREGRDQKVST
jgi:hypothetical protein